MNPALVAAGMQAGASLLGGIAQNQASAQAAQRQMDFQKEMSDTSYQRQVRDLEAAGINPMLVTKLGGASTPPGAMPSFGNIGLAAAQGYQASAAGSSSAAQAAKTEVETDILDNEGRQKARLELDQILANIGLTNAQISKVYEEIKLVAAQIATEQERPAQVRALIDHIAAQTKTEAFKQLNLAQQTELLKAQIPLLLAQTTLTQNQVKAELNTLNMRRHVEQVLPAAGAGAAAIGALFMKHRLGAAVRWLGTVLKR